MVSEKLGQKFNYHTSENLWDAVRQDTSIYKGAEYYKLNAEPLQWPVTDGGTVRLHEHSFRTDDGFGKLCYEQFAPRGFVLSLLNGERPKLTLSTGRTISHYNNASQTKQSNKLLSQYSEDIVLVNHETAKTLDLGKMHSLKSAYGQTKPLTFKEDKKVPSGVLFATFHFKKSDINKLFGDEADSTTLTPRFKAVEVEII
jgi:formate dehydrogenase major subunit